MTIMRFALSILSVIALSAPALAAPPPGAASCSGCHAMRETASSVLPRIYGRDAKETTAMMVAFRNGSQSATVMTRIAKGFSDDELRAIAAWLATQK